MEAAHLGSGNRICSVLFVDIVKYSQELVSEQVELKARFGVLLASALEHTPASDRLVLDTGDGAALCFLGDPEDALFAANILRSAVLESSGPHPLCFRLGINLGPVRVVKDINGHANVIGDGINVAQRVMSFAEPNQILVSRSYYEVVSRLAPEYAQLFQYAGLHRDKHVREHEVYQVQISPSTVTSPSRAAEPVPPENQPRGAADPVARPEPAVLERLGAALAREIGPVARLMVRRAAERAGDVRALGERLAEHVPESRRTAFLEGLAPLLGGAGPARAAGVPGPVAPPDPRSSAAPPREIGPEVLARAEQLLTRRIGPVARILVRRAATQAESPRALYEGLALHIDDVQSRALFLAEAGHAGA